MYTLQGIRPYVSPILQPSEIGLVMREIKKLAIIYPHVILDYYVVMPNHVHMIIVIDAGRTQFTPTVSRIIKQWKGTITKQIGLSLWQKSFHDRIIRNTEEYIRIQQYIQDNPVQWEQDCFYSK